MSQENMELVVGQGPAPARDVTALARVMSLVHSRGPRGGEER
jgi:hypothetical protein